MRQRTLRSWPRTLRDACRPPHLCSSVLLSVCCRSQRFADRLRGPDCSCGGRCWLPRQRWSAGKSAWCQTSTTWRGFEATFRQRLTPGICHETRLAMPSHVALFGTHPPRLACGFLGAGVVAQHVGISFAEFLWEQFFQTRAAPPPFMRSWTAGILGARPRTPAALCFSVDARASW